MKTKTEKKTKDKTSLGGTKELDTIDLYDTQYPHSHHHCHSYEDKDRDKDKEEDKRQNFSRRDKGAGYYRFIRHTISSQSSSLSFL